MPMPLRLVFLDLHGHGYDLGLVFFGINSLIMGVLVWRSGLFARGFGVGLAIAGSVYLVGSGLRFFAPGAFVRLHPGLRRDDHGRDGLLPAAAVSAGRSLKHGRLRLDHPQQPKSRRAADAPHASVRTVFQKVQRGR